MTRLLALSLLLPAMASQAAEPLTVDMDFMLEPIVITAPRNKIPAARQIDPRINSLLLRLLQQRADLRPDQVAGQNASAEVFSELTTLTGHTMSMRYSELGFLLTEGLAGSQDFQIQSELERIVRSGKNPQMRAGAMVALAYTKDSRFLGLFQTAIRDPSLTVRLGALESLIIMDSSAAEFSIAEAAQGDASFTVKVMAAAAYWQRGNLAGREMLLLLAEHADWYVRANAIYQLGRLGRGDEYRRLLNLMDREKDLIVRAELTLALIRLERFK
ncbi:MAG: HEAT repeat domain-containing protein [Elusimicrobia bacterium]|nr:HEAT repeat domain-containing protein [Elusimicrobiota bacterium]